MRAVFCDKADYLPLFDDTHRLGVRHRRINLITAAGDARQGNKYENPILHIVMLPKDASRVFD